ncbi:NAD-dependent epimerase/dehydratase family protein [Tunicatimonas pelagia]|uniref:NAD-dependent epimerase/dehydratase family protein n=1 Tax=Tunicatimonas pelagia TaxID=931531 RepID=UPI00266639B2|nr:NAD(P)-dependent oxidoreductase [Tunicatimonas pelagia]WKN45243.1 NAD(P)-dependent oxidoreductase [Tunicatimonas pelagia]
MKVLITGSSGHLGEAIVRKLRETSYVPVGVDIKPSEFTTHVGSITDRDFVMETLKGVDFIIHTATLHKPHVATHTYQDFVDTNITGTLNLLEVAAANRAKAFIYTSTTSTFGDSLTPPPGELAVWVTEQTPSIPKNIYGVTKEAAENLVQLFSRNHQLPGVVLKTSRFFPEEDDKKEMRDAYEDANLRVTELLYRRVDLEDAVSAHLQAIERAEQIGFGKYIISATSPFQPQHLTMLHADAASVVRQLYPDFEDIFSQKSWKMVPQIDRVYVNKKARLELGWQPKYDFRYALDCLKRDEDFRSPLARTVGIKGYHPQKFIDGPYPVTNH